MALYQSLFPSASEKFVYIPLGIAEPEVNEITKGDYIFSVGRSNRDYDFMCRALEGTHYQVIIATDTQVPNVPDNVTVLRDCFDEKMLKMMAASFCVLIPLQDSNVSSGQLALMQAMYIGKPVIVTDSSGITDYVCNGKTGLVIKKTAPQLMMSLERLQKDDEFYSFLSTSAREYAINHFSEDSMGKSIAGKLML